MTLVIQAAAAHAQMLRSSRGEDWHPLHEPSKTNPTEARLAVVDRTQPVALLANRHCRIRKR